MHNHHSLLYHCHNVFKAILTNCFSRTGTTFHSTTVRGTVHFRLDYTGDPPNSISINCFYSIAQTHLSFRVPLRVPSLSTVTSAQTTPFLTASEKLDRRSGPCTCTSGSTFNAAAGTPNIAAPARRSFIDVPRFDARPYARAVLTSTAQIARSTA